jgi:RNA polymerase sigma factor (sigma-70 family)
MATLQIVRPASPARWKSSSSCTGKPRSKVPHPSQPPNLAARDALIEQHIGWARDLAAKVAGKLPTWFLPEDLEGAAAIALLESAAKYDASRGIPFRAYAILHVQGACYSAARRNEYRERAHEELPEEEQALPVSQKSDTAALPPEVWQLPPDQFRIIQLCYLHDLTVEAAAVRMGISASRASQYHRTALAALRGMMTAGKAA